MLADWLMRTRLLDVTGSRPNSSDFSEIYFLETIHYPAHRDLKRSV